MIFYLGDKVDSGIRPNDLKALNKLGRWEYGYNKDYDIVIISKDGTLGEVYEIMGVRIGLPAVPDKKEIINYGKQEFEQKWVRPEKDMPKALDYKEIAKATGKFTGNIKAQAEQSAEYVADLFADHKEYIDEQYNKRNKGIWIYIKGNPVYVPGTYWFGIQWCQEIDEKPKFRIIQNEFMIFWEACKADPRCYGLMYVKNRRMGASLMGIFEMIDSGTLVEDKLLGLISKKGKDAAKIFRRLVNAFRRLPSFFRPVWDGTNNPKSSLNLEETTKKKAIGDAFAFDDSGLGTVIEWHNTDLNAMDGDAIYRSLVDEAGKYPREVPFSEYWDIVKTSHRKGIRITGKSMVVSTVNPMNKGGAQYKSVWSDSSALERNKNGQTTSGLYRILIPTRFCLEGLFDEYGYSIVEDPEKPIKSDEGVYVTEGSLTFIQNTIDALKLKPEKLNEFKRQNPENERDAFRDSTSDCEFNLIKITEQLDHNQFELEDAYDPQHDIYMGNSQMIRGNFRWKDGVPDTEVEWSPDPENGRFFIKKGCMPTEEYKNKWEMRSFNGQLAKSPLCGDIGAFGFDPYNRSVNADGRGSKGSIAGTTGTHTNDYYPREDMFLEYIARPRKVEQLYEDMIMCSVYFSMPFLAEQSNDQFLKEVLDRGYRHYSMNNPLKHYSELTPTEKEFGGAPQQDSKIANQQYTATEAFIEDQVGVALDDSRRKEGEMGRMIFSRTLYQIKEVDTDNRTKFDAYIAFSLSRLAVHRRIKKQVEKPKRTFNPLPTYDNSGTISKIAV